MTDDPIMPLSRHINRELARQTHPLFLVVNDALELEAWRGNGDHYGLPDLAAGQSLTDALPMLETVRPEGDNTQAWRFVTLPNESICHVHLLRTDGRWGVILLDASREHAEQHSRQQAAHELLLLREERDRLIRELEQANRLKGEFIARMSHEFRTPLSSVIGYSDELRELKPDDPDVQFHLSAVGRGGRYLLNLVENLLDQARIETGQLVINPAGCDLHDLSGEIEQLLRPVAQQKSLSLAWFFDAEVPDRVWVDATRLKQVLINLVGNAIKFTKTGSVNVEFAWQRDRLTVAVEDTGPGIPTKAGQQIFEPFQQAGGPHAKGAGLGLTISRALVEAMDGRLSLSSEPGQGSRFEFDISAPMVRGGRGGDPKPLQQRRILIADDDGDLRALFTRYLSSLGCALDTAANATEALETVRSTPPDLLIMDVNLGKDDGRRVANKLRDEGFTGVIIALSAEPSAPAEGRQDPFDARWGKPIHRSRLIDGIRELLN